MYFEYNKFTLSDLIDQFRSNFKLNTTYSFFIKISSNDNLNFKMCGPQIGIIIKSEHDLKYYEQLYSVINIRIESTIEIYDYIDDINAIEIYYSIIVNQKELTLKNISSININKQLTNVKEIKNNFNNKLLPLTTDESYFGFELINNKNIIIDKINTQLNLSNNNIIINELDKFHIYQPSDKIKYIIVSKYVNNNQIIRYIFDYNTGIFIKEILDEIISIQTIKTFNRTINSVQLTIKNQEIIFISINYKLNNINSFTNKFKDRNTNIGVIDIESFRGNDGLAKVYALGFLTNLNDKPNLYYLSDYPELNSHGLILKCIDDILINKYNNFIFYAHNLANFDVIFIYNSLLKANLDKGFDYYKLRTTMRDNQIIRLDIKITILSINNNKREIKVSLFDSYNLLKLSLDKLALEFNLKIKKGKFPYSFVKNNNLNYIGNLPDIHYFEDISINEYNQIKSTDWNLRFESLSYLSNDLNCLLQILNQFSSFIFIHFNVQMTEALTITRLALNIFKQKYFEDKNIPNINKLFLFNFIKEAYFGGITEVYKPHGTNLTYLDVNSLYPYVALNPMPGTQCKYLQSFNDEGLELDNLFGFFYAKIKTNDNYIGLLPLQLNNQLTLPKGEFSGIWSSEELKFAKLNGYQVKVIKGYNFNKVNHIFDKFVKELYEFKNNSKGYRKTIYKSILNNLLGRFGLNILKPVTQTVNLKKRDFLVSTRVVNSEIFLNDHKVLITYQPNINRDICAQHGLDYLKILDLESKLNIENNLDLFKDVSISTAAMINSYARIHINSLKLEVINNGGTIYYSDTDSLVINNDYFNPDWVSDKLGKLKIEYEIDEAYFISNKTYCLRLKDGNIIIKTKGILNNSLTIEDFKNMYLNNMNVTGIKNHTTKNYEKGSVLIEKKEVILNYDSYIKREKVYNENNIWIDTKPLNHNTHN